MIIDNPKLFGSILHKKGFRTWFKYVFRTIEQIHFIEEPLHQELFNTFQDIYDLKSIRNIINVSPRSGKTTMMSYFVAYALVVNPKCNFIYTSYSQNLLASVSKKIQTILENEKIKAMYELGAISLEDIEISPIDESWREYFNQQKKNKDEKQNMYSASKITTGAGGVILFSSIGGAITGHGCGIRGVTDRFSGMLVIDDANKVQDVRSKKMREKVFTYYSETLLSRLNHSGVAIVNIQQRLHLEDLTGCLLKCYDSFRVVKQPLIKDNACQLPSQYSEERIKELRKDNYTFQSQYQQEPIMDGGNVIKKEWFKYYHTSQHGSEKYKKIFITADTAMKTQEHNDYSVFCAWGLTTDSRLLLLDMLRGKWESTELEQKAINIYSKWRTMNGINNVSLSTVYIEDKASGTGLIQRLKRKAMPISGVQVNKDKAIRLNEVLTYIEEGAVFLPENRQDIIQPFLNECMEFTRDNSHKHDDIVDCLTMALNKSMLTAGFVDYGALLEYGRGVGY